MSRYRKAPKGPVIFRIALAVVLVGACVGGLVFALQNTNRLPLSASSAQQPESSSSAASTAVSSSTPESSEPPVQKPVSITILGAGDDLIHDTIYKQASQRAGGKGFDFTPVYARIADDIKNADISVVNQETVLASKVAPLSGYPRFNSPVELGDELVNLGFDVINHANNHVLDQNQKGLAATLDYWATKPSVKVIGAYRNDADMENIRIVEAKGIKTAHIGITEMTNGLYLPKDSPYRIIYADNTQLIERLIKKAKTMADVVVISVH